MTCRGPSVLITYESETEIGALKSKNKEKGMDLD